MNNFYNFDEIIIESSVKDHKNTKHILSKIKSNPVIKIRDSLYKAVKEYPTEYHPADRAKKLYLGTIRGDILKKCPGTHGHLCCNYHVINLYIGCPVDCSYCILQSYLNQPFTVINVDIENIFDSLHKNSLKNPDRIYRIGTGELGDSLIYDYLTDFSIPFIEFFSKYKNYIFEFKTKTDYIDNILTIDSPGNIVIGFSVNPELVIDSEEKRSAPLDNRLTAAGKLIDKGYKIALHFDPIINISDFERNYSSLIEKIFKYIKPSAVAWISLGTFRYTPDLKNMSEYNYPHSKILLDEFFENNDKKFRYFLPVRQKLYNFIIDKLNQVSNNFLIYLCMESPHVWQKTLGYLPRKEKKLEYIFKNALTLNEFSQ